MEAERPNRVSDLFHQAVARPPEERRSFLDEVCRGQAALREEVESLLRFDDVSARFLESPAAAIAARAASGDGGIAVGRELGPYRILALLGAGGMGEVYRAHDGKLGRDVAIKILAPQFTSDPERRARFSREARLLATLNHPHIGAIYGVEEAGGVTALVLELVEGPTLAECLERGPIPIPRALAVGRQVADALDAAHEKGIVHRDLKPANIVLNGGSDPTGSDVRVKVLDFGLAKSTSSDPVSEAPDQASGFRDRTAAGRILGTPAFMSPEQARGLTVDKRTDIWAFGCVLFQMLSGRPPFEGPTATDVFVRILEHEPEWSALPSATPDDVRRLLRRCLEKDPARRLRDIGDASTDLAERPSLDRRAGALPARAGRLWPWPWWTAAAGVILATTLGAVRFIGVPGPAPVPDLPVMRLDVDLGSDVALDAGVGRSRPDRAVGVSPDGERLAFISGNRLWTRRLNHTVSASLTGTEGVGAFFFAPDSQSVAFVADDKVKRVALDGGPVTTLCDNVPPVRGGSWDGDTIVLGGTGIGGGLLRVPAGGGPAEPLTRLEPGEFTHRWPHVLPGARAVLFTSHRYPAWFGLAAIDVLSLADGRRKRLLERASFARFVASGHGAGSLTFLRDGTLFAVPFDPVRLELRGSPLPVLEHLASESNLGSAQVDASATGTFVYRTRTNGTLAWIDAAGATRRLPFEPGSYFAPILSPDGERLAFMSGDELWVYDLRRDVRTLIVREAISRPLWSPDGQFLVFTTTENLFAIRADGGSEPRPLLPPKPSTVRLVSSMHEGPGGARLAYLEIVVGGSGSWDLWTVPVHADVAGLRGSEPEAFLRTSHDERNLRFSPDGRWVAYSSSEAGERRDVYVRTFPDTGRSWKISDGGGDAPQWSTRRAELFFQADRTIMVAPYRIEGGRFVAGKARPWTAQPVSAAVVDAYSLAPDGLRILALVPDLAAERRSQHVVTLWTNAVKEFGRPVAGATGR